MMAFEPTLGLGFVRVPASFALVPSVLGHLSTEGVPIGLRPVVVMLEPGQPEWCAAMNARGPVTVLLFDRLHWLEEAHRGRERRKER